MFTGIIQDVGVVRRMERSGGGAGLWVATTLDTADFVMGESIAVNGVCLTVTDAKAGEFRADVSSESLARTTLGHTAPGAGVNLERAMQAGDRFGGHFVLGHVDGVGRIVESRLEGAYRLIGVAPPPNLMRYMVVKGSVAVNGVSLTVNSVGADRFSMMLIPTTLAETNLERLRPGDDVNIETDVIGKYVERFIEARTGGITLDKLREQGWD